MDSILVSVKKMLGIAPQYIQFDEDIIMHVNTAFFTLLELGIGPKDGFQIEDGTAEWDDFLVPNPILLNAVKTYISQKVRLAFDPPTNSAMLEAIKESIREAEWRMNIFVDPADGVFID